MADLILPTGETKPGRGIADTFWTGSWGKTAHQRLQFALRTGNIDDIFLMTELPAGLLIFDCWLDILVVSTAASTLSLGLRASDGDDEGFDGAANLLAATALDAAIGTRVRSAKVFNTMAAGAGSDAGAHAPFLLTKPHILIGTIAGANIAAAGRVVVTLGTEFVGNL